MIRDSPLQLSSLFMGHWSHVSILCRHICLSCCSDVGAVVVNKEGELVSTVNQIAAIIDAEKCSVDRRLPKGKVQQ